jgi:acetolactate synthase-1/2/3 large subunit
LATIKQERLPVKILNLNNSVLGMIRQWQELFHDQHYSECDLSSGPDFVKLAEAFGLVGLYCDNPAEVDDVLAEMIKIDGPVLVNMVVSRNENVYPMIPAGAAHNEIMLGPTSRAATGGDESMVMA